MDQSLPERTRQIAPHVGVRDEEIVLLVSVLGPHRVLVQDVRDPVAVRQVGCHGFQGGHDLGLHHGGIAGGLDAALEQVQQVRNQLALEGLPDQRVLGEMVGLSKGFSIRIIRNLRADT